jgi:MFS family permease
MAPAAAPALGITPAAVGYFVTVVYLGSMIGTATAGGWSARFGPIRVSQVGLMLCLAGLAVAASGWLPAVILGALLLGLGYGPATPASSMILARAAPPHLLALTFPSSRPGAARHRDRRRCGARAGAGAGLAGAALVIGAACAVLALLLMSDPWPLRCGTRSRGAVSLRSAFAPVALVVRDPAAARALAGVLHLRLARRSRSLPTW